MTETLSRDPLKSPYAETFRAALQGWTDERHLSRSHMWALWVFTVYLKNVAEGGAWRYDGHSWKEGGEMGTLVVKATVAGKPVVCFTSARTNLSAISIFVRKMDEDSVMWVKDRYRT